MKKAICKSTKLSYQIGLMLFLLLALSPYSHSQIVYTDIDDITLNVDEEFYEIDLNNDGNFEISLLADDDGYDYWLIRLNPTTTTSDAEINGWDSGIELLLSMLEYGEPINSNTGGTIFDWQLPTYTPPNITILSAGNSWGSWVNANQKYLAVQFTVDSDIYYGWVKLSVGPYSEYVTIHDFAYNSEPNQTIMAGETGSAAPLTVDFQATSTYVEIDEEITFYAQVYGGTEPYSYEWDFNNDGVVDATNPYVNFSYNQEGVYSVRLTVTDADNTVETYTRVDYITVIDPVGVAEKETTPLISYSHGSIKISQLNTSDYTTIKIYDEMGKTLISMQRSMASEWIIPFLFPSGLYIIYIENNHQNHIEKIMINL